MLSECLCVLGFSSPLLSHPIYPTGVFNGPLPGFLNLGFQVALFDTATGLDTDRNCPDNKRN